MKCPDRCPAGSRRFCPGRRWAVKRARPSKKVWYSGLGLSLEMSLVFDFGQGLRCGLYIRHCRCHWIMAAWFVFLHFFLVPLCWYAVSERQILLVCTWRHGGHVGGQEQKHFPPLGTKLYFHVNSSRKYSFVLTPNMAALSRGCKPRIGIFCGRLVGVDKHLFQRVSFITSMTLSLNYIFVLLLANVDVIPKQKQLSTV